MQWILSKILSQWPITYITTDSWSQFLWDYNMIDVRCRPMSSTKALISMAAGYNNHTLKFCTYHPRIDLRKYVWGWLRSLKLYCQSQPMFFFFIKTHSYWFCFNYWVGSAQVSSEQNSYDEHKKKIIAAFQKSEIRRVVYTELHPSLI